MAAERDWLERKPASAPSSRYNHAMAYDAARREVVLFGGIDAQTGAPLDDTWTWNGNAWSRRTPAVRPQARSRHSMTYDNAGGRVLLYGPEETGKELWAWDGSNWAVVSVAPVASMAAYPALAGATITFDRSAGELILHRSSGERVWAWNGTAWRPLAAPDGTYRPFASLAHDSIQGKTVLFGGAQSTFLNDTWLWDGAAWQRAEPATAPPARDLAAFTFDSRRGVAILFGGNAAANGWAPVVPAGDTWEWSGSIWTPLATRHMPPASVGPALAYDAARDEVLLFGGYDNSGPETTWTGTWVLTAIAVPVTSSFFDSFHAGSYDPATSLPRHWVAAGAENGGCTAARGPQSNIFCSTNDFLTPASGQITLRGRVQNRVRKGSEIRLRSPLPVQGTFAARLRVSGPDEGIWGNAPIKAFFTYTPHAAGANPCNHMEHDFEVLTGTSALYGMSGQWMPVAGWTSNKTDWEDVTAAWESTFPMLANITHAHEGGTGCPANSALSRNSLIPLGVQAQFLTYMVTVKCLAEPCAASDAPYEARYFAGRDSGQFIQTAVTRTTHRLLEERLYPMFNLWWLDPKIATSDKSLQNKVARSTTADQVMDIDWFFWNRSLLTFEEVHRKGMACDAAGRVGPDVDASGNPVAGGGCQ
jgi:hypothetical protein